MKKPRYYAQDGKMTKSTETLSTADLAKLLASKKQERGQWLPRGEYLAKRSKELNKSLPRSEKWFQRLYIEEGLRVKTDLFNEPFMGYIPDVLNHNFKYTIEVQGSVHEREEVKLRDKGKRDAFVQAGYAVFYVMAYSHGSYDRMRRTLLKYRWKQIKAGRSLSNVSFGVGDF